MKPFNAIWGNDVHAYQSGERGWFMIKASNIFEALEKAGRRLKEEKKEDRFRILSICEHDEKEL